VVLVFAPGEDMVAQALVNLVGVRGGCWLVAAIVPTFFASSTEGEFLEPSVLPGKETCIL
jgi:hypothetical protein